MTIPRANMAEEEYFRQQEAERRRNDAWESLEQASRDSPVDVARAKEVGPRSCPVCELLLKKQTLRSVETDHCDSCGGVWLDAGKLELLTEQNVGFTARLLASWRGGTEK